MLKLLFMTTTVIVLLAKFVWVLITEIFYKLKRKFSKHKVKNRFLEGNYAPVADEKFVENLEIIGKIPSDLEGMYVRDGPNPQLEIKNGEFYHWFDGDGMLHGVQLQSGNASYRNRYVKTVRYQEEKQAQKTLFVLLGAFRNPLVLFLSTIKQMLINPMKAKLGIKRYQGVGTANTAVTYHAGRFYALVENDVPYQIQLPNLDTLGRYDYNGEYKTAFTAHPKIDSQTQELVCFGINYHKNPFADYYVINSEHKITNHMEINLPVATMMHDFATTKNYSILMNFPLTFRPERVVFGKSPFLFEKDTPSLFGIFKRNENDPAKIRWIESPSCFVFHIVNSWEENEDEIILIGCRSKETSIFGLDKTVHVDETIYLEKDLPYIYGWKFNLSTGDVTEKTLISDIPAEFPRVSDQLVGYRSEYAYASRIVVDGRDRFLMDAVIKMELKGIDWNNDSQIKHQVWELDEGKYCGEWVFVKKEDGTKEDDGYLLCYVHDEKAATDELWVLDAGQKFGTDEGILARVKTQNRIPYGFHGRWMTASEIENQILQ